jgi:transcriptional regulator with XRE-family HTH domain
MKTSDMKKDSPSLAAVVRRLRTQNEWTLKEMSEKVGIPVSTLGKVERGDLTLTYEKLQQISERLDMRIADFFAPDNAGAAVANGRRSIATLDAAARLDVGGYEHFFLCTELRNKLMVPVLTVIRAKSLAEFGGLVKHPGEEFLFVVSGSVHVITEFYDDLILEEGTGIYIDSNMGHAYLAAEGYDEVKALSVMAGEARTGWGETEIPAEAHGSQPRLSSRSSLKVLQE